MPDTPKSQQIIAAVVARLGEKIVAGTDYFTTLGTRTVADEGEGPTTIPSVADSKPNWAEGELPAITVFEGRTETVEQPNARRRVVHVMPLMLKGFIARGETDDDGMSATTARQMIADIKRAILGDGTQANNWLAERWPDDSDIGLAMETREKDHSIDYADETYQVTGVQVEIEIMYTTGKLASN